jgi:hypothetical protein
LKRIHPNQSLGRVGVVKLLLLIEELEGGVIFVSVKDLPVSGYGNSIPEALSAFSDAFELQWKNLVEGPESDLSPKALEYRKRFLEIKGLPTELEFNPDAMWDAAMKVLGKDADELVAKAADNLSRWHDNPSSSEEVESWPEEFDEV